MKECSNCGNYSAFYTKNFDSFKRERQGRCDITKKSVQNHDSCSRWRNNLFRNKVIKAKCIKTFNKTIKNLAEINQILNEVQEESQI